MIRLFFRAFIAEVSGTIAGFGSSSIFLPIANQYLTYQNALVLVALYHIFGNTARFSLFWKHWDRKVFFLFGIPSIFATVAGALLVGMINPYILKIVLGTVLIIFALYSLVNIKFTIKFTPLIGRIGGALSGFSAGLIGTGGVLRGAFMTLFGLSKERYIATIASVALLVDFTRIPLYFGQGFLDPTFLRTVPVLFVIAFIGSFVGKQIVKRIDTTLLKRLIMMAVIGASVLLIIQGFGGL